MPLTPRGAPWKSNARWRAQCRHLGRLPDRIRIGINVGGIIIDEGDIYGDGVNIAARIETLARPGAICLSDNAYKQVKGKVGLDISDMGEQQLKNIAQPVRVYGVRLGRSTARPTLACLTSHRSRSCLSKT